MFVSQRVIHHGIIALEAEIARLKALHHELGDEWPPDFDPNDLCLFDIVLQDFYANKNTGYNEINVSNKPFRFFVALICEYVRDHELSREDESALFRFYSEAHIRQCLQYIESHSQSSPSFVESQILRLGDVILKFPIRQHGQEL